MMRHSFMLVLYKTVYLWLEYLLTSTVWRPPPISADMDAVLSAFHILLLRFHCFQTVYTSMQHCYLRVNYNSSLWSTTNISITLPAGVFFIYLLFFLWWSSGISPISLFFSFFFSLFWKDFKSHLVIWTSRCTLLIRVVKKQSGFPQSGNFREIIPFLWSKPQNVRELW